MARAKLPTVVEPEQLARAMESDPRIRLLDVRTAGEFARTHVAGSYHVPLDRVAVHLAEIGTVTDPIVLVCRSGARARTAEEMLRRSGMRNVHLLNGGLLAWRSRRLPVRGRSLSSAELLRRLAGGVGLALAALYWRSNPLLALTFGFLGLRLALGLPVLPCAAAGTCAVPGSDTAAQVRALVTGAPADPPAERPTARPEPRAG